MWEYICVDCGTFATDKSIVKLIEQGAKQPNRCFACLSVSSQKSLLTNSTFKFFSLDVFISWISYLALRQPFSISLSCHHQNIKSDVRLLEINQEKMFSQISWLPIVKDKAVDVLSYDEILQNVIERKIDGWPPRFGIIMY